MLGTPSYMAPEQAAGNSLVFFRFRQVGWVKENCEQIQHHRRLRTLFSSGLYPLAISGTTLLLTPGTYSSYVTANLSAKSQRWRTPVSSGSRPAENDVLLCPGMNAAAVLTSKLLSF